jgi:AICAR transformylase/IMP cyclohydrolase PurH
MAAGSDSSAVSSSCGGQPKREDSAKFAWERAADFEVSLDGCSAATDSFIFDHTNIALLHKMGVAVIVQPTRRLLTTGSLKTDAAILEIVNDYDMVMLRPYLIGADGQQKAWRVFRHI